MTEYSKDNSALVAVIGLDQPGIVAAVSTALTRLDCNIEEMTQSTLHDQFSGIYLVNKPAGLSNAEMEQKITEALSHKRFHLSIVIRDYEELPRELVPESDPFVISIWGRDGNNIVSTFSKMMSEQKINIHDLRAKPLGNGESVQIFEVAVPKDVDFRAFHRVMSERARAMGLTLTMQHRRIFDAMHRIDIQ